MRERLVMAIIDALQDGDPTVIVAVGTNEIKLTWANLPAAIIYNKDET